MSISKTPAGLTEGRVVHYIPGPHDRLKNNDRHVAAVVVKVWDRHAGTVNLRLLLDGSNDTDNWKEPAASWVTSVPYDETGTEPRSWHYPERVE